MIKSNQGLKQALESKMTCFCWIRFPLRQSIPYLWSNFQSL